MAKVSDQPSRRQWFMALGWEWRRWLYMPLMLPIFQTANGRAIYAAS